MIWSYKVDILEKFVEFLALFYFVFGSFTTYAWASKELDKSANVSIIVSFWNPVAVMYGVMNLLNVVVIIICVYMNHKHSSLFTNIIQEHNLIFYVLSAPLLVASIVYLFWNYFDHYHAFARFLILCEIILFIGSMCLIVSVCTLQDCSERKHHLKRNNMVILITLISMLNYIFYHVTSQQIHTFVYTASHYEKYTIYYNYTVKVNTIHEYGEPLVFMFSCCCFSFLISLLQRINNNNKDFSSEPYLELTSSIDIAETENLILDQESKIKPFKLPSCSLLLGILFIALTALALLIVMCMNRADNDPFLLYYAKLIFALFPLLVYIVSLVLLCIQLNAMEHWPKLSENCNFVDKILVWIGASGQLMCSLAQIKLVSYQFSLYQIAETFRLCSTFVAYFVLIIQTLLQSLTICLALDRKWLPPLIETWQESIFPPVGLVSINVGMLLFSLFDISNVETIFDNAINIQTPMFLRTFILGFHSFGLTLSILSRLHSSFVFAKMITATNNRK